MLTEFGGFSMFLNRTYRIIQWIQALAVEVDAVYIKYHYTGLQIICSMLPSPCVLVPAGSQHESLRPTGGMERGKKERKKVRKRERERE